MGYRATEKADREKIQKILKKRGKNLSWLAATMGIHPNTLSRYLKNGFPTIYHITLVRILELEE